MAWRFNLLTVALMSALGGVASCHLVFESGQPHVDVWFVTDEIRNDNEGLPITQRLVTDLSGWQFEYSLDGAPPQPANLDLRKGHVWFERLDASTPYAIWITAPGQPPLIIHGKAPQHYEATTHYGRLDAEAQTAARQITLPPPPTGTSIMVASTGTYASVTSTVCGTSCDWKLATPFEQPRLPDAAFGDRVYGLLFNTVGDQSFVTSSSVQAWQLSRQPETLMVPIATTNLNEYSLTPSLVPMCQLLMGLAPQQNARFTAWQIIAAPVPQDRNGQDVVVPPRGFPLARFPAVDNLPTLCVDSTATTVKFANPFRRTMPVMQTRADTLYSFTSAGAIADLTHNAYLRSNIESFTEAPGTVFTPKLDGALARNVTVNATAATPEQSLVLAVGDLELAWTKSASEQVDDWVVHVYRLYTDVNLFSKTEVVATVRTRNTAVTLPAELLPAGNYIMSIEARVGYPGAAAQDYRQHRYPFWTADIVAARLLIQ